MAGHADHDPAHPVLADPVSRTAAPRGARSDWRARRRAAVPVLPVRSAPPETRPGTSATTALRQDLRAALVASFSPAFQVGSFCSKPGKAVAAPLGVPACAGLAPGREAAFEMLCPGVPLGAPSGAGRAVHSEMTSSGTQKVSSAGRPRISLVAAISSGAKGSPCALGLSVICGAGQPMWERSWRKLGLVLDGHGPADGRFECVGVVGYLAEVLGVPAVGVEPLDGIVVEGDLGGPVDGDVVVVVYVDQPPEAEVAGERGGLVADAFHQVAVAADHEGVVVDQVRPVSRPEEPFGHAQPYAVGKALPERAGRDLDSFELAGLRVARGPGAELAELFQVLQREVVARQEQHRVQQDAGVAGERTKRSRFGQSGSAAS